MRVYHKYTKALNTHFPSFYAFLCVVHVDDYVLFNYYIRITRIVDLTKMKDLLSILYDVVKKIKNLNIQEIDFNKGVNRYRNYVNMLSVPKH